MKKILLFLCVTSAFTACNKKDKVTKTSNSPEDSPPFVPVTLKSTGPLTGRWEYVENYLSPGPVWHWEKVQNGAIMNIKADSTYEIIINKANTKFPFFTQFAKAHKGVLSNKPVGDDHFKSFGHLLNTKTNDTQFVFYRKIMNRNDTLDILLPCVEGCIFRFVKQKN